MPRAGARRHAAAGLGTVQGMCPRQADEPGPTRILLVGGGYVGLYTALGLQRRLRAGEGVVTVVNPTGYMTYQPFLPEAAAGSLEPRHVVVPLRRVLANCRVVAGSVVSLEHARRTAVVQPGGGGPGDDGAPYELRYDQVVVAPGAVPRTMPIPGLAEVGIGFTTVEEAVYLRNHVLSRLDAAATTADAADRERALTFVFVGGGYAGVEALGELEDMARDACRYYRGVRPEDMRWVLVEAAGRILPDVSEGMARLTAAALRRRGIDVRLGTRVTSVVGGHVRLSDGTELDTQTVVWTAGMRPHPMLEATDLPRDAQGRVCVEATLRVTGAPGAWAAGDAAAVPDLTGAPGTRCAPSAQHAVRQARVLADNLVRDLRGQPLRSYRHAYAGSVASLGLHQGVADLYGVVKLRGPLAWFLHRTYHLSRVPTINRKVRVAADWTLALFFRREVVSLGRFADPRAAFRAAAATPARGAGRTEGGKLPG